MTPTPTTFAGASLHARSERRFDWIPLFVFGVALGYVILVYAVHFERSINAEFCEYGCIGRNLLRDGKLRNSFCFPAVLAYLHERSVPSDDGWPAAKRSQLFALLVAGSMSLFGVNDFAVYLVTAISYVLCAVLLYLLGREMFSRTTGLFAALFSLSNIHWINVLEGGYRDFTFAALLFLQYFIIHRAVSRQTFSVWTAVLLGILAGLAWMIRNDFILLLPALTIGIAWAARPAWVRTLLAFCILFAVTISPNLAFNYRYFHELTADPERGIVLAEKILVGAEFPADNYIAYSPGRIFREHTLAVLLKWPHLFFHRYLPELFADSGAPFVFACFIATLLRLHARPAQLVLWMVTAQFVTHLFVFCFLSRNDGQGGRFHIWFWMFAMIYGVAFIERYCSLRRFGGAVTILGALLFFDVVSESYDWAIYFRARSRGDVSGTHRALHRVSGKLDQNLEALQTLLPVEALVISDKGHQLAWYAERTSISLPHTYSDLLRIVEREPVEYVYLAGLSHAATRTCADELRRIVDEGEKSPFQLVERFPDGALLLECNAAPARRRPAAEN
jgi:hypothetical protein